MPLAGRSENTGIAFSPPFSLRQEHLWSRLTLAIDTKFVIVKKSLFSLKL